jgi:hypothetical protein
VLLHAVVQISLDPAAIGEGAHDQPLTGCAQLRDFGAQVVERLAKRLVPGPQDESTSSIV